MSLFHRQPIFELINVHRVQAPKDVMLFLKNAEKDFVEGLFYTAKRYGRSSFYFAETNYEIHKNKDSSFTVVVSESQTLTPESLS